MRSGLALAGRESNSGLVRIGMEHRGGVLVRFRRSQKRASGGGGSMENGMRCRQSQRGREALRGRRSPISGAAAVLPNRSFLLHHQIRPGFLPPLSSLTGSETPRPAARRATQRTSPHRPSRHPLSLSRERGREEGVGPACQRVRSWLCRQNRGSDRQRCPYTFFRCRDAFSSPGPMYFLTLLSLISSSCNVPPPDCLPPAGGQRLLLGQHKQ
jgi:hypothetical protein